MVVEKAKGSDEWNCFSDHDEADFSASYEHVFKMGSYQNVQCLAIMVAADEAVAKAASLVEPVQLDPPVATAHARQRQTVGLQGNAQGAIGHAFRSFEPTQHRRLLSLCPNIPDARRQRCGETLE